MRSVMVGGLGLGALLVSFAVVFFLWGPAPATSVPTSALATATAAASAPKAPPANSVPAGHAASSPAGFADTTGSIGSAPPARPQGLVAAAPACQNPDALGISRTVEIDTTDGPGFGFEHFKQHDFLQPGEVVLTFDDGPWPHNTPAVLAALAANCPQAGFFPIGGHS